MIYYSDCADSDMSSTIQNNNKVENSAQNLKVFHKSDLKSENMLNWIWPLSAEEQDATPANVKLITFFHELLDSSDHKRIVSESESWSPILRNTSFRNWQVFTGQCKCQCQISWRRSVRSVRNKDSHPLFYLHSHVWGHQFSKLDESEFQVLDIAEESNLDNLAVNLHMPIPSFTNLLASNLYAKYCGAVSRIVCYSCAHDGNFTP